MLPQILLILCAIALPAQAQVYKWVDANGNTQYGDMPPDVRKGEAKVITTTPTPKSSQQALSWEEKEREFRRRKIEQENMQPKDVPMPTSQQICASARQRIRRLDGTLVYRLDKNGERIYMEDKERAAIENQAKQDIANHCRH
jgi:hypothetical protein